MIKKCLWPKVLCHSFRHKHVLTLANFFCILSTFRSTRCEIPHTTPDYIIYIILLTSTLFINIFCILNIIDCYIWADSLTQSWLNQKSINVWKVCYTQYCERITMLTTCCMAMAKIQTYTLYLWVWIRNGTLEIDSFFM